MTIDAIGCQTKIAEALVQRGGDYLLPVKENQGQWYQDLQDLFAGCLEVNFRKSRMVMIERSTKDTDASRFDNVGRCPTPSFWITCPNATVGKTCER